MDKWEEFLKDMSYVVDHFDVAIKISKCNDVRIIEMLIKIAEDRKNKLEGK